jgi:hypothetical protein
MGDEVSLFSWAVQGIAGKSTMSTNKQVKKNRIVLSTQIGSKESCWTQYPELPVPDFDLREHTCC